MNLVTDYVRGLFRATRDGWDRFWFAPADPATLGMIRILAGAMLFYTHLVWSRDLLSFFGPKGWLTPEALATDPESYTRFNWSHLYLIHSPSALWIAHIAALVVFALMTVGLFTRVTSILAFLLTVSYANRVPLAQFGLDTINCMLAMYLAVGPSGAAYSVDRWLARRRGAPATIEPTVGANLAIRLIQVHMCIIYLFSGLGKLKGDTWWEGTAIWGALANYEYQSFDMTWLAGYPILGNFITQFTVAWEVAYCALVWPRWTRPIMIALAVPLHLGIAFCMGMMTFGLIMLVGNLAFVSPALVRAIFDRRPAVEPAPASRPAQPRRSSGRASPAQR